MSEDAVLLTVVERLEGAGVPYMVVGSYASNAYGRPRSSFDADVVVDLDRAQVDAFVRAFAPDFVIDAAAVRRDVEAGRMFNLIPRSGIFKVGLIPLRRTAFAREEFGRRRRLRVFGRDLWLPSPEDVILSKLAWHRRGGEVSERQIEDARDVYRTQQDALDRAYLERWAGELGIADLLERVSR